MKTEDNGELTATGARVVRMMEQNKRDMDHLHDCIHEVKTDVKKMTPYFEGIEPAQHIIDHHTVSENREQTKEHRREFRYGLWTFWAGLATAISIGIGGLFVLAADNRMEKKIDQILEKQGK